MSERGDSLVKQTLKMCQIVPKHVLSMKAKSSTLEMKYFVRERKDDCWSWRESWVHDGERGGHGLQNSRTTTFRCEARAEYQRSRIDSENWEPSKSDMFFNKIYDKINHLIPSVQNQNKWFRMWVTSNYVNCSRRNPKRSAQCIYHTGIPVYSTARAGISCKKKEGKIRNSSSTLWTSFPFLTTI